MKTSTKIIFFVIIPLTVLLIIGVIVGALWQKDTPDDPSESLPSVSDTDIPGIDDTDDPMIPKLDPDDTTGSDEEQDNPDDITIDVGKDTDSETRRDEPHIDGDVVIIPGVKGEDE